MELFGQHEADIVTLQPENCVVVIGSYTGNTDLATDKINADTELAKLFPNRFKESATVVISSNIASLASGFDSDLVPLVYKNDVLLDEDGYSFVAGTGVFSAFNPALEGGDTIKVTLVKPIYGVNAVSPTADFPVKVTDVKGFGSTDYIYRTQTYDDSKYAINIKGAYDVRKKRRKYAANEIEKAIYGAQWSATTDVANEMSRNSNPFFAAIIWWYPDAASGELIVEKMIFYACTLNKGIMPIPSGTDKEAEYEIDASSLYAYRIKTLKT